MTKPYSKITIKTSKTRTKFSSKINNRNKLQTMLKLLTVFQL
jgi:hypothetical protein